MKHDAVLIDAGTGNLLSVYNALRKLGFEIKVTTEPEDLIYGERIILPGVGAFGKFMNGLRAVNLDDALTQAAKRGNPLLGICVGLQAFFDYSEEMGNHPGLALFPGYVTRFTQDKSIKVPHTGWNQLWPERESKLLNELYSGVYTYFNHSFYCKPANEDDVITRTDYGIRFASIVQWEMIFGVQFHPEKSQRAGLQILQNFMRI